MESPFIETGQCNLAQLCFLAVVYGYIVLSASNLISDGSEYLMLIPSLAGMVGSIVLPVLGAVPDGFMSLCSGLGPRDAAQESVSAGIGVMAGSTVMLLTFPWFIAVMYGRVPLNPKDDTADFSRSQESGKLSLMEGGISFDKSIASNSKIMLATTLLFFIIQVPSTMMELNNESLAEMQEHCGKWALCGMICCFAAFVGYLVFCYLDANEDKVLAKVIEGIKNRDICLTAALSFTAQNTKTPTANSAENLLPADKKRLQKILRPFFKRYDQDGNQQLSAQEFILLLQDLGERTDPRSAVFMFQQYDKDKSGEINFSEFTECLYSFLSDPTFKASVESNASAETKVGSRQSAVLPSYDIEGEEEEEMDEDLANLPASEQRKCILMRAGKMMLMGTILVLSFSDPLVDTLTAIGTKLNVSPFYIAFVVAPFASNASELISAKNYASKKTQKGITTSLGTLVGAACMNNTFGMGIVFGLIYFQGLAWKFQAETIAIVVSQWFIGALAITKSTHTVKTGIMILAVYPLSLALVTVLYATGMD